jgi:hypothetical protein
MRLSIFAIALLMAIGLLAAVPLGSLSKEAGAQEFVKKKKGGQRSPYAKKVNSITASAGSSAEPHGTVAFGYTIGATRTQMAE